MKKLYSIILVLFCAMSFVKAQVADVNLQIPEPFFDAMLDALFKNANPPEYPLTFLKNKDNQNTENTDVFSLISAGIDKNYINRANSNNYCRETIKLQRQIDGVKTAVRFRGGQITAPIAFTGNYNPPLIGCVEFSGIAETVINLEFDENKQSLLGRARVTNVKMSGTGGVGSGVLARMVQSSIDKKVNPIQILTLDKISFTIPIQNAGSVRMIAKSMRHELADGFINVRIVYDFQ